MKNFVFQFPKISADYYFTYDVVQFIVMIFAVIIGIVLCFWGYKCFQTLCVLLIGIIMGTAGLYVTNGFTENAILKMCLFVIFSFIGTCFVYFLSVVLGKSLDYLHMKNAVTGKMYILSGLLGAGIVACVTWCWIYRGVYAAVLFLLLSISGILVQHKKKEKHVVFHSYDDICRMKPLEEKVAEGKKNEEI